MGNTSGSGIGNGTAPLLGKKTTGLLNERGKKKKKTGRSQPTRLIII